MVVEPDLELLGWHRPAQVVTLCDVTAQWREALHDSARLHPLGHHAQTEVVTEVDRRADDDLVLFVGSHR